MDNANLDKAFQEAYERASQTSLRFPPDLRLRFYALYKHASKAVFNTKYLNHTDSGEELVNAFKMNSLFQIKNMTQDEAKQNYIDLVNEYIPEENN